MCISCVSRDAANQPQRSRAPRLSWRTRGLSRGPREASGEPLGLSCPVQSRSHSGVLRSWKEAALCPATTGWSRGQGRCHRRSTCWGLSIPTFSALSLSVESMFLSCPNGQTSLRAPSREAPAGHVLKFSGTCRAGKPHGEALAFGLAHACFGLSPSDVWAPLSQAGLACARSMRGWLCARLSVTSKSV